MERVPTVSGTANLLDILDRVLDKGLVIAGDVRIALANVELPGRQVIQRITARTASRAVRTKRRRGQGCAAQ